MRRGVQLIERKPCEYRASNVCWGMLTGRHPAPHLIKNDDSCKAHFGGLFLWAKKSPHGFMQARQLHLDFVPVYVFLSGSRKILSRIHFVNNGFESQGHAFAWLFLFVPPEHHSLCALSLIHLAAILKDYLLSSFFRGCIFFSTSSELVTEKPVGKNSIPSDGCSSCQCFVVAIV